MTANNTADIYFANKIYKDANKTDWDFAKAIGEPSIYIVLGSLTSYPITDLHQFVSEQYVVEGKDYELKYQSRSLKNENEWVDIAKEFCDTTFKNHRRIVAVPVAPQKLFCQGGCIKEYGEHKGEVIPVIVCGQGYSPIAFNYCENAIAIDRKRGFHVEEDIFPDVAVAPQSEQERGWKITTHAADTVNKTEGENNENQ